MPQVDLLKRRFEQRFFRERELTLDAAEGIEATQPQDTRPEAREIAQNYSDVADKAEAILNETVQLAIVRRVPVIDAPEVASAVIRQDPESNGEFITFDLYRKAYEYQQREGTALPVEVLDELTGDVVTDRRRTARRLRELVDDISTEAAELLGDQIVTLFVLKLLQLGMDAISDGAQTATKQPSGAEVGVVAFQIAVSALAQQLYAGLNEERAEESLEELRDSNQPFPEPVMQEARSFLQNSTLFQTALLQRRPSDFQLIVSYVEAFLDRQREPGWETWQLAPELRNAMSWARESASMLRRYPSRQSRTATETPDDTFGSVESSVRLDVELGSSNVPQPDPAVLAMYNRGVNALNRGVDRVAYVLSDILDRTGLCCFLKWAGEVGERPVRLLRSVITGAPNALKKLNQTQFPVFNVELSLSTLVHQRAMLLLQDLQGTAMVKIREWMLVDTDRWGELFAGCKLIDELFEFVLLSLEQLEAALLSLLNRYLGFIEDQEVRLDAKVNLVGNQKRLRFQMLMIDQFLEFGVEGGICPDTPVEPMQIATAAERIINNVGPTVALPVPIGQGNRFQTLQSPPVELSTGITVPGVAGASSGATVLDLAREACQSGIVRQNLVPFPRG